MTDKKPKRIFFHFALSFCILIFAFCVLPSGAKAEIGLSVAPQKFDIVVLPGDTFEGTIFVSSLGDLPLPVSLRVVEFGAEDNTGDMILREPKLADPFSPASWFSFEQTDFILEPGVRRDAHFAISAPPDAPTGGYYAFLLFEPRVPEFYLQEQGPRVVPVVGVPFLISTASTLLTLDGDSPIEVAAFSIVEEERLMFLERFFNRGVARAQEQGLSHFFDDRQKSETQITNRQPRVFSVRVKNNDLFHIQPLGKLEITGMFGIKIGEADLRGQTILPGRTRDFTVKLESPGSLAAAIRDAVLPGRFRAEFDLRAQSLARGELRATEAARLTFFSVPFQFWGIAFALALLLFMVRRRIAAAVRVLIR